MITAFERKGRIAISCERCPQLTTVSIEEAERMSVDADAAAAFLARHAQTCAGRKRR